MSERVWKWQPKFVSPSLLLKMKIAEKDVKTDDEALKQKPTIPKDYRTAPLNLGPEIIIRTSLPLSLVPNQIESLRTGREDDARNFAQNVQSLPVKISQMICHNSEDKSGMKSTGQTPREPDKSHIEGQGWSTDIVKQVESWMRTQRLSEQYAPSTQRSQCTPPPMLSERNRKKRKKRHNDDGEPGITETMNYNETEIVTANDNKRTLQKLFEPRDARIPNYNLRQKLMQPQNGFSSRESYFKNFERSNKFARFGSIHDEIEFQKRYKRISDLQDHLKFVEGSYLSGKNILSEEKRVSHMINMKKYHHLNPSDMFAVSPFEHGEVKPKTTQRNQPEQSPSHRKGKTYLKKASPMWQKYQKLPSINTNQKPPKKALSESNVKFVEDEIRDTNTSRSEFVTSTRIGQIETPDERSKSVITDSSYGTFQEMKVTIQIRYKNPRNTPEPTSDEDYGSDTDVESCDDSAIDPPDGRIHSLPEESTSQKEPSSNEQKLRQNAAIKSVEHKFIGETAMKLQDNKFAKGPPLRTLDYKQSGSPPLRNHSRTSNISKKSKEHYINFEGGTLSSLNISDPVSKPSRLVTGRINE